MTKKIVYKEQIVAILVTHNHKVNDAEFITEPTNSLQVGLLRRKAGDLALPHSHLFPPTYIDTLQEVIYVISGRILMSLYDKESGNLIEEFVMQPGDFIIHMNHAHGVKFLEESLIFEVKQGPYPGNKNAKVALKARTQ